MNHCWVMAKFPWPPLANSALSPLPFNFLSRARITFLIQNLCLKLFQLRQGIVYTRCRLPPLHLVSVWATLLGMRAIHHLSWPHFTGRSCCHCAVGVWTCSILITVLCSPVGEQPPSRWSVLCLIPPGVQSAAGHGIQLAGANRSLCKRVKWFLCLRDQQILNRGIFFPPILV